MTPRQMFAKLENTGNHYSSFKKGYKYVHFSTGGWSYNEDLIYELKKERVYSRLLCKWEQGGHYTFIIPKEIMDFDFKRFGQNSKNN
jgi:hypothetical protein